MQSLGCNNANCTVKLLHLATNLKELCCRGLQMLGNDIFYHDITLCRSGCKHKGPRLNLIRNNRVLCLVKLLHTADTNNIRTCTFDIGSHTVQEIRNVYDMWLPRAVLNNRISIRHRSRHHDIDRRPHRNGVKENMTAVQMICLCNNKSVPDRNLGAKRLKAFQVKVDRSAADVTSSRKRNLRLFVFAEQRANQIIGRADFFDIFIFNADFSDMLAVQQSCMPRNAIHLHTDTLHRFKKDVDVTNIGKIFNQYRIIRHNSSCKNTERRILCSANFHFTNQRIATPDNILFHRTPL